jgi:hypothetical protein
MSYCFCNQTSKVNRINCTPGTIVFNTEVNEFYGSSLCLFWRPTSIQILLFLILKLMSFMESVSVHFGNKPEFKSTPRVKYGCLLNIKESVK